MVVEFRSCYYSQDLDVDENTGDVYVVYREFNGRMRAYDRADDGSYCPASSCYTQVFTGARYATSVDVQDGYVYTSGYYYSSYYGGVKKMSTSSLSSITTCGVHSHKELTKVQLL